MNYLEALTVGAALACVMYLIAFLSGKYVESSIDGKPEAKHAGEAIPRRSMLEHRLESRRTDLAAEIARLNVEVATLRRKRFTVEKELVDAKREAELPIRVIGREGSTPVHFRAWVINRQVQNALSEGKQHPTLDAGWATPQIIEIWADNLNDARKELQRVYPMPLGFSVLNIKLDVPLEALAGAPDKG